MEDIYSSFGYWDLQQPIKAEQKSPQHGPTSDSKQSVPVLNVTPDNTDIAPTPKTGGPSAKKKCVRDKSACAAMKANTAGHAVFHSSASTSKRSAQTKAPESHVHVSSFFSATDRSKDSDKVIELLKTLPDMLHGDVIEEFSRRALLKEFPLPHSSFFGAAGRAKDNEQASKLLKDLPPGMTEEAVLEEVTRRGVLRAYYDFL